MTAPATVREPASPTGSRSRRGPGGKPPPGEPRAVALLYLLPGFLVFAAFLLFPLGHSVWISLFDWDGLTLATWVGFGNYVALAQDPQLREAFGHALILLFFYAVVPIVVGLLLTAVMSRARVRGMTFFRTVLFVPQVVAMVVVATAWSAIYAPDGVLNVVLRAVGLGAGARPWLGDFDLALPAVGFIGTWVEIGLALVLFLAGVQRVPTELYEAARLDGAGPVREFFAVTLPALRGEIAVATTLTVVAGLRTFDLVYITTHGGPGTATSVPAFEVYHRAFETNQVGSACAIGVTLAVLILVVTVLVNRISESRS